MLDDLASDADRDRAVTALQGAFAEGRLTKDEFEDRVDTTLGARTYGGIGTALAGLPQPSAGTASAVRPEHADLATPLRGPVVDGAERHEVPVPGCPLPPGAFSGSRILTHLGGWVAGAGCLIAICGWLSGPVRTVVSGTGGPRPAAGVPTPRQIASAAAQWEHFGLSLLLLGLLIVIAASFLRKL